MAASLYLAYVMHGDVLHVLGAPGGSLAGLRPVGTFTPDWPAVHAAAERIRALVHHAADAGEVSSSATVELEDLGGFLFDELVPLPAKRWLRDGAGDGELTLSLPWELLGLPWELLHMGREALCLRWAMGRVLQLDAEPGGRAAEPASPRSLLIVADPDGGLNEAYDEGMLLRKRLQGSPSFRVSFRAGDVDAGFLRRHARSADLLHFAGHIDASGWRMSESCFGVDDIARLSGGGSLPSFVFANGCAGARVDDAGAGMVSAWLSGGCRHYLAPLFDLPDRLGRLFAASFYERLAAGASVGEAVQQARAALAKHCGPGATAWGAYVLYGDPSATYAMRAAAVQPRPVVPPTRLRADAPASPEPVRAALVADLPEPVGRGFAARAPASAFDWAFSAVVALAALAGALAAWWALG